MSLKEKSIHKNIPQDVYDIVFLGEAEEVVKALAQENGLSEEEVDLLTTLVENVFLGDASAGEFPNKIKQSVHLPEEKAQKIISFIKEELFDPFDSSIQEAHKQKINQKTGAVEVKINEPESTFMHASAVPVYKLEGFGQARNTNETVQPTVKTGNINYQSGVSLKDTLLGTNPKDSSFAKKLEELGKEGGGDIKKEDPYREAPTP